MRFSKIGTGAAAIAAAAALTACGGHGTVPSSNLGPATANGLTSDGVLASGLSPDAGSKCSVSGMYYFQGSCAAFNMKMKSITTVTIGKVKPYQGIVITTSLSPIQKPPNVDSVPAIMGDAIGKDVTGKVKNKAFPLYGVGNDCVSGNGKPVKCVGKVFIYAELINTSKYNLKPLMTPGFYITDQNGFPGKTLCYPAILTSKGWAPNTTVGGKPNGKTLRIASVSNPGQLIYLANAQFIVAGVCQ